MAFRVRNIAILFAFCLVSGRLAAQDVLEYVNPFVGTSDYGATNPGALVPNGMMSVSPFNVMGSDLNRYDKDFR